MEDSREFRAVTPLELSASQRTVVGALQRHDTDRYRLSQWYLGALYAVNNPYNPDRFSQAAQSLRELLEKLPRALGESNLPAGSRTDFQGKRRELNALIAKDLERYPDGWEGQEIDRRLARTLREVAAYFRLSQQPTRSEQIQGAVANVDPLAGQMDSATRDRRRDAIVRLWRQLESFAHHQSDDEGAFDACLGTLERTVLDLLAPITAQDQQEIQSILDNAGRTTADVNRIFELIDRRGANYAFFFNRASDPSWVEILKERGYFAHPPSIQELDDGQVHVPSWWPMRYLARMAALDPDEVIAIVQQLPRFNNPSISDEILDIARQFPGEQSAQLLPEVIRCTRAVTPILSYRLVELLAHWTDEGQTAAALELTKKIVYFAPDPEQDAKETLRKQNPHDWTTALQPFPRLDRWDYMQLMEQGIRQLAAAEPYQSARLLISAVNRLIRQTLHQDELDQGGDDDYSQIWYQRLDGPSDTVLQPSETLVFATTYACEQVWERDPDSAAALDEELRNRRWRIFRRLRQHLYALHPDERTKPWIRQEILQHQDHGHRQYHYEFQQMLRSACETLGHDLLTEEELTPIFEAILDGPDREATRRSMGEHYTEELFERRRRNFHRLQLQPFRNVLFGKYRDYLQDLEKEAGISVSDEDYMPVGPMRAGMISEHSPISVEELAGLEDEDLLSYINNWDEEHNDAEDQLAEVTIDALSDAFGQLFQQAVIPTPDRLHFWLGNRHRIERPIYVRKMLGAMNSRVEAQDLSDLDRWLEFCEWVLSHPDRERQPSLEPSDRTRNNPYWGDCRRAVGDLLGKVISVGLENGLAMPLVARDRLSILLGTLCTEHDWPLDEDRRAFSGHEDAFRRAIGNTRSRALADLLKFGRWLRNHDPQADVAAITATLEGRFSPTAQYPLTTPERAILGIGYLDALAMDESWALARKSDFFPRSVWHNWVAPFGIFLHYHHPHRRLFGIFEDDFAFAAQNIPAHTEQDPSLSRVLDTLGQRLLVYHASGMFPLLGDGSPLESYYLATVGRRQQWAGLFENVGRILCHHEGELDEAVKSRYEAFFEWRLEVGDPTELARFDAWLGADCLSAEWRLEAYSRALDVCQIDRGSFRQPWAALSQLIPEHTGKAVACFAQLVEKSQSDAYVSPEPAKRILNAGLTSAEPEVHENAERALEILLANGQFDVSILDE